MSVLLSRLRHSHDELAPHLVSHNPPRRAHNATLPWVNLPWVSLRLLSLSLISAIATQAPASQAHPSSAQLSPAQPSSIRRVVQPNPSILAQADSTESISQPAAGAEAPETLVPESSAPAALESDNTSNSDSRLPSASKGNIYSPVRLSSGLSIEDTLTTKDIPLGQGSFARDYLVTLQAQDQIAIDLSSENFDTVVTLMSKNGTTLGENDDGPDGGTNSLLFMRITEDGDYVVRVRGFGQAKGGPFKLKLTRLKAVN